MKKQILNAFWPVQFIDVVIGNVPCDRSLLCNVQRFNVLSRYLSLPDVRVKSSGKGRRTACDTPQAFGYRLLST
ncbi:hypothetical protein, partial [Sutterella wadsworthensis]|uniref:hypothetical protein n=1 Tax=Sutterella wadsworthensis TaxID=40545 RepID=UPI00307B0911